MSDIVGLVSSIIQFLGDQLNSGVLSADATESLEVAIQCLESAYGIDRASSHLAVSRSLLDIFAVATQNEQKKEASEVEKQEAELLKNEGNELMKAEELHEALERYNRAIALDANNAVFYCNRAAAHSKLNDHASAISDCKRAITLDPAYSKAYGRMGLAHSNLNEHKKAIECYEKAVKLEPENDTYLGNLRVAEEKLKETNLRSPTTGQSASGQQTMPAGLGSLMGGFGAAGGAGAGPAGPLDLGTLFNNPALMNMATQMMADPGMQQMLNSMLSAASGPTNQEGAGGAGFDALFQAGQQLAAQMQATNPNLVDQLRQQMNGNNPEDKPDTSGDSKNN